MTYDERYFLERDLANWLRSYSGLGEGQAKDMAQRILEFLERQKAIQEPTY